MSDHRLPNEITSASWECPKVRNWRDADDTADLSSNARYGWGADVN